MEEGGTPQPHLQDSLGAKSVHHHQLLQVVFGLHSAEAKAGRRLLGHDARLALGKS